MSLTVAQLKALSFGYLTGADLLQFCPAQLLIKQYEVDNNSLQRGATLSYSTIVSNLNTRYDLVSELAKNGSTVPDTRCTELVRITSVLAVKNALGNMANASEFMMDFFSDAKADLLSIRNGQMNLALAEAGEAVESRAILIPSSFSTLG